MVKMTKEECENIFMNKLILQTYEGMNKDEYPMIDAKKTIETKYGWVFFYNSIAAIVNQDSAKGYIGNSPVLVDKFDGSINSLDIFNHSIENCIVNYGKTKKYLEEE